ncbi:MAG: rhomboid family intramembrane serine protease [Bacteroidota bacterium]
MELSLNTIIVGVTVLVSLAAFNNRELLSKLMFNPYQVKHRKQYYRVVTHAFIHADFMHLFFNMYVLWSFGGLIESIFTEREVFEYLFPELDFWGTSTGYLNFVLLYFGGVIFATLPSMRKHGDNPGYNSLGASGAVSSIVLAAILLMPTMDIYIFFIPIGIPAFIVGAAYLAYEYYMSRHAQSRIAHDAHYVGAIFGLAFLLILKPYFGLRFLELIGSFIGLA